MTKGEGTMLGVLLFPFPWPPPKPTIIYKATHEGLKVVIEARENGRLALAISEITGSQIVGFISQPIQVTGIYPAQLSVTWAPSGCSLRINKQELLPDLPGIQPFLVLPPQRTVSLTRSLDDPQAVALCQKWIANRKAKFSKSTVRPNRRPKTLKEEADDLRNSVLRLRHLQQQTLAGQAYLLGTLAGEMRAAVYWPRGRDAKPDDQWNPLLLRMASKADLPLPVYFVPKFPAPPIIAQANIHLNPDPPRIGAAFPTDQICDLQEVLVSTVLRLGPSPGKTIIAVELIKELAHTMGAAHYDVDASEFLDVMHGITSFGGDQVTTFMCHTAEALVSLSEWVLSELKTRKLIG